MNYILIDGVKIYEIEYNGDIYYPFNLVIKTLLRKTIATTNYNKQLITFNIKFEGENNYQVTIFRNKDGWYKYLSNCKKSTLDKKCINRYNLFSKHIGLNIFINDKHEKLSKLDKLIIKQFNNIDKKRCIKCNNNLPRNDFFYISNSRYQDGYENICKKCKNGKYTFKDRYINSIVDGLGEDACILYLKGDFIKFYMKYCHNNNFLLKCDKKNELEIIKHFYKIGKLKINNLINKESIYSFFNFKYRHIKSINELIYFCTDGECVNRPYNFPSYKYINMDIDSGVNIFKNYIKDNNIIIDDIFKFDYMDISKKAGVYNAYSKSSLDFVVKLNNYKYAGYMYKISSVNYYKNKDNVIFDFKYLVEDDLKCDINKIPLYITPSLLSNYSSTLYRIYNNIYKNNMFSIFNMIYPNKFIESDFRIGKYRNEFDSNEESIVDSILRDEFGKSVIYNSRNADNTIEIDGMIPDWIIVSKEYGTIIVEYFGMYYEHSNSSRCDVYVNKTKIKIEKYKKLISNGKFKCIFLYNEDLRHNCIGMKNKLIKFKTIEQT